MTNQKKEEFIERLKDPIKFVVLACLEDAQRKLEEDGFQTEIGKIETIVDSAGLNNHYRGRMNITNGNDARYKEYVWDACATSLMVTNGKIWFDFDCSLNSNGNSISVRYRAYKEEDESDSLDSDWFS